MTLRLCFAESSGDVHKDHLKLVVWCLFVPELCKINNFIFLTGPVIAEYPEYVCRI